MFVLQLFLFTFMCACAAATEIRIEAGRPLPHAELLETIIKRQLFPNKTDDVSFIELYGNVTDLDSETLAKLENLEFNVLDREGLTTLISLARRSQLIVNSNKNMSGVAEDEANHDSGRRFFHNHKTMIPKLLNLMRQSIYATRYRMDKTKDIRKRFGELLEFNMGVMFGNLMELRKKSSNVLKTMNELDRSNKNSQFIWFLSLYERLLALHTDVTSTVNRLFAIDVKIQKAEAKKQRAKLSAKGQGQP